MKPRFAILVSGRGSNMQALLDADAAGNLAAQPVVVFSNNPDAPAVERAITAGVPTEVLSHKGFSSRCAFDDAVANQLLPYAPDFVVLAGYMRIVSATFLDAFGSRVINIHPSLLPAFPGTNAVAQAWAYGVKVIGCTVHFVDAKVDHGPIILQRTLVVQAQESADELAARLIEVEHQALRDAVNLYAQGRTRIEGRRVDILAESSGP